MLAFDTVGGRAFAILASVIIVAILALNALRVDSVMAALIGVPIAAVALVIAGWIVVGALVGVQVSDGEYVGGGPMLKRVRLDPGETVVASGVAGYEIHNAGGGTISRHVTLSAECCK